jgi:dienelactone hydrolase
MRWLTCVFALLCVGEPAQSQPPTTPTPLGSDVLQPTSSDQPAIPLSTLTDRNLRRDPFQQQVERVMGVLPDRSQLPPAVPWKELDAEKFDGKDGSPWVRKKIELSVDIDIDSSRPESLVRAYVFLPRDDDHRRRPAVLCLHQTNAMGKDEPAGISGNPHLQYALELAQRGFITLAPDYPSFGEHPYPFEEHPEWVSGSLRAVWENMRAIDWLEQCPAVDPNRIGCIGHSLGGHNTIFTAFHDLRIRAAVSSCGFTRFHKYYQGNLAGWSSPRYMPRIATLFENSPDRIPWDFPEMIAALAPRAFMTSSPLHDDNFEVSGVRDCMESAAPVYARLHAADRLQAIYPDCNHDFPDDARESAYSFLEKHLPPKP